MQEIGHPIQESNIENPIMAAMKKIYRATSLDYKKEKKKLRLKRNVKITKFKQWKVEEKSKQRKKLFNLPYSRGIKSKADRIWKKVYLRLKN